MDEREYEQIAEKVAEKVMGRLFLFMGINAEDPKELVEFQKDFARLRGWRRNYEIVRSRGIAAATGFVITGVLGYMLFLVTKHY